MKLYSAKYAFWHPLDVFYPKAKCVDVTKPEELDEPGILIVHGGGDIHPSLYGEVNKGSYVGDVPSSRDTMEWELMKVAARKGILIFGICRGAQMGCALAGGKLIQDVAYHHNDHFIETEGKRRIKTNSIHHQMMYPWSVEHRLIAWTLPSYQTQRFVGITKAEKNAIPEHDAYSSKYEPEIVWFPSVGCLAVQGHPEMLETTHPLNVFVKEQLRDVTKFSQN